MMRRSVFAVFMFFTALEVFAQTGDSLCVDRRCYHSVGVSLGYDLTFERFVPEVRYDSPNFLFKRRVGIFASYDHLRNPGVRPELDLVHRTVIGLRWDVLHMLQNADVCFRLGMTNMVGSTRQSDDTGWAPGGNAALDLSYRYALAGIGSITFKLTSSLTLFEGALWYEPQVGLEYNMHHKVMDLAVPEIGFKTLVSTDYSEPIPAYYLYLKWAFGWEM